jgi:hypothetical protein
MKTMLKHAMPYKYSLRRTTAHIVPLMYPYGAQPASYEIMKFAYGIERFHETASYICM